MRSYVLRCELKLPSSIQETFRIFENPGNLSRITPPWLGFRMLTPEVEMRKGAVIDYSIRWAGIPVRWQSVITDYTPPYRFVDVQSRGPYTLWRHLHMFHETPQGCVVTDEVRYVLPFGPLGQAAHGLVVANQLLDIFLYRQQVLAEMMGGAVDIIPPRIASAPPMNRAQASMLRMS